MRLLLAGCLLFGCPEAFAQEREEILRFLPPDTPHAGYRVYLVDESGAEYDPLDLGFIRVESDGVGRFTLLLSADLGYYVSMTAYNDSGAESVHSNVIFLAALSCDPAACDDGNPCTVDLCEGTACSHPSAPEGSPCTLPDYGPAACFAGRCEPAGCLDDLDCPETGFCQGLTHCVSFTCEQSPPPTCPLPPPCHAALCSDAEGCFTEPLPDGTPCDDGRSATYDDRCFSGACIGDEPECQVDADCSDGDMCNGEEFCSSDGLCVSDAPLACGSATQCADPYCDPVGGCQWNPRPEGAPCDDGLLETHDDRCVEGACVGIEPECRADAECADGNLCNGDELCSADGICVTGTPLICERETQCADPYCDPVNGCGLVPHPDGTPCYDGRWLTFDDHCVAGKCVGTRWWLNGRAKRWLRP